MQNRAAKYKTIRPMFKEGEIKSFLDIFEYVPKSIVALDLGKKIDRFTILMNRVEKFTLAELISIGKFCNLDEREIVELAIVEYLKRVKKSNPGSSSEQS